MNITLKLFALLREYIKDHPNGACDIELQEQTTVQDVLSSLRIPGDMPKIILINGVQKTETDLLNDGDTLSVFPPIAGG
jgi:sulfur-carrier protein